jgi:hypothetical protein
MKNEAAVYRSYVSLCDDVVDVQVNKRSIKKSKNNNS